MPAHDAPDDDKLDETIEETFPASDAPANTPETGIRVGDPPAVDTTAVDSTAVTDDPAHSRFELTVDGHTGYLAYERTADQLTILHTEVPLEIRGRHLGERLVEAAVSAARSDGLRLVIVCPFARAYLRRHRSD